MRCYSCGGFNVQIIDTKTLSNGDLREEWKCYSCLINTFRIVQQIQPTTAIPVPPQAPPHAPVSSYGGNLQTAVPSDQPEQTRQDKINSYWDERKKAVDSMTELDQWMEYYYLNKLGVSVIGLEHKIEVELKKKFPADPKKPAI